jgi:hypothetical protein
MSHTSVLCCFVALFVGNLVVSGSYVLENDDIARDGDKLYRWFGSSPFCDGHCRDGMKEIV